MDLQIDIVTLRKKQLELETDFMSKRLEVVEVTQDFEKLKLTYFFNIPNNYLLILIFM